MWPAAHYGQGYVIPNLTHYQSNIVQPETSSVADCGLKGVKEKLKSGGDSIVIKIEDVVWQYNQ